MIQVALISHIYFPLLAVLLPSWLANIGDTNSRKTVLLIAGSGAPRDSKAQHNENSTYYLACLMKLLVDRLFPDINVRIVFSEHCNLFRYDENIKFVKGDLAPVIENMRDEVVAVRGDKWKDYFKITVWLAYYSIFRY